MSTAESKARPGLYRSQINRLWELDDRIRRGSYPSCMSFAREWEVSRRTILRDIELLRMRGAPVEYDAERRGFFYSKPNWRLPALDLTEGELLQLAVVQRLTSQYRGTPLAAVLDGLFDKIRAALPERISVDPVLVDREFSFHGQPVRDVDERTWVALARAVRERLVLKARYRPYGKRRSRNVTLHPLHLACIEGEWYAIVQWPKGWLGHFAVSRFERAHATRRHFVPPDFDPEHYFANRFGRFVGVPGDVVKVVVHFAPSAAEGITERRWHARQEIKRHGDGSVTLAFPAPTAAMYAVKRWILQWGGEATVLEPGNLEADVRAAQRRTNGRAAARTKKAS